MTRSTGRRAGIPVLLAVTLLLLALGIRVALIREPLNSDDLTLMGAAERAVAGDLPAQRPTLPSEEWQESHQDLRLGIIVPTALVIRLLGANIFSYYFWPLVASLAGIALAFQVTRRYVHPATALLAAAVQVVNPLELSHASLLLSDLPCATLGLAYLLLILYDEEDRRPALRGVVAGLVLLWVHLLRLNAPVTLIPGIAVGLAMRSSRQTTLTSLGVAGLGVFAEALLYAVRGAELGYRHHIVALAVRSYRPFLDTETTLWGFLWRYPEAVARMAGLPGLVLFLLSVACHIQVMAFHRDVRLRAVCACGLLSLSIAAFAIFAPFSEGFVVQPPLMRYIELFLLTSVPAVTVVSASTLSAVFALRTQDVLARLAAVWSRLTRKARLGVGLVACAALLVASTGALAAGRAVLATREGFLFIGRVTYLPVIQELMCRMESHDRDHLVAVGPMPGIRGLRLFSWLPGGRRIEWRGSALEELLADLREDAVDAVAADVAKERLALRYLGESERKARSALLDAFEQTASDRFETALENQRFVLWLTPRLAAADCTSQEPGMGPPVAWHSRQPSEKRS